MAAVGNGFIDSVLLLISQGANVLAEDNCQRTALHRAVSQYLKPLADLKIL